MPWQNASLCRIAVVPWMENSQKHFSIRVKIMLIQKFSVMLWLRRPDLKMVPTDIAKTKNRSQVKQSVSFQCCRLFQTQPEAWAIFLVLLKRSLVVDQLRFYISIWSLSVQGEVLLATPLEHMFWRSLYWLVRQIVYQITFSHLPGYLLTFTFTGFLIHKKLSLLVWLSLARRSPSIFWLSVCVYRWWWLEHLFHPSKDHLLLHP